MKLLGTLDSASAYAVRDFLHRSDVPFDWIELTSDAQAREQAQVDGLADRRLPVCEFDDGTRLYGPTLREITEKLGWFKDPSHAEYDFAIYGAGAAGLSAAVYGASEGRRTVLIEPSAIGGQAGTSSRIENYLGFPQDISGADLAERAREQACRFGAEILLLREGVGAKLLPGKGTGYLADGTRIVARATLCATGVQYRLAPVSGRPSTPMARQPYYLETSAPGLFAAGDVRHGSVKRCASAVGEGAMAVAFVHRYLADE